MMKKILNLLALLSGLGLLSCQALPEGFGIEDPGQYSRIYIAASYNGVQHSEFTFPENVSVNIYANYSGVVPLHADVNVSVADDLSLTEAYNAAAGTSYPPVPAACYVFERGTTTIPSGSTISAEPAVVTFLSAGFLDDGTYLLPVKITEVSDPSIALTPALSILYLSVSCKAGELSVTFQPLDDYNLEDDEKW